MKGQGHAISVLCELMEVSQSGYFSSLSPPPSARQARRARITQKVISIFHEHKGRYGRPRIFETLKAQGEQVSEKMVGTLIREQGLKARKKRPFRPRTTTTGKQARFADNRLGSVNLKHTKPDSNQILVSDITYVATQEGWLYLAAIMDLHTKVIKGYALCESMPTSLVAQAFQRALNQYPNIKGAILHSDRGCQYTSREYLKLLGENSMQVSMSAKGYCYDNAAMESFWSTLKTEGFPDSGVFKTKEAARQSIFEYIEGYYHSQRLHSSLGYRTPLAAELSANYAQKAA